MNEENSPAPGQGNESMQFRVVPSTDLLRLGLTGKQRPVDRLVELLERVDAGPWLDGAVRELAAITGLTIDGNTCLAVASLDVDGLERLKEAAKESSSRDSGESNHGATAAYFIAVAAARVQHQATISSAPEKELRSVFLDLASVTTDDWQHFWTDAARSLTGAS